MLGNTIFFFKYLMEINIYYNNKIIFRFKVDLLKFKILGTKY